MTCQKTAIHFRGCRQILQVVILQKYDALKVTTSIINLLKKQWK